MASLKELHQLAHSLSKSEKRYVKLFAGNLGGKAKESYLLQIDNLLSIREYNEQKLKSKMQTIATKRLSEFNTNLFDFITKALVNFHSDGSTSMKLLKNMMTAEVLSKKGLHQYTEKQLDASIKKYETYGFSELIAYQLKQKYKLGIYNRKLIDEIINTVSKREQMNQFAANESAYIQINYEMGKLLQTIDSPRTKKQTKAYLDFLQNPLLISVERALSPYAKHYYYMIKVPLLVSAGKIEDAIAISREAMTFTQHVFNKKIDAIPVSFQLRRYLNLKLSVGDTTNLDIVFEQLGECIPYLPSKQNQIAIWSNILDARLLQFLLEGKYEAGILYFEQEAKQEFEEHFEQFTRIDATSLLIARLYFMSGKYHESLSYCENALNCPMYKFDNFIIALKCLILLNHHKLNNRLLLPYAVKSLYRSLKKTNALFAPEKALLSFLGKIKGPDKLQAEIEKLKTTFEHEAKNPLNNSFFANGDYLKWLDGRLN